MANALSLQLCKKLCSFAHYSKRQFVHIAIADRVAPEKSDTPPACRDFIRESDWRSQDA
jgi:hypothetical protein